MRSVCYFCHIKTIENLIEKFEPGEQKAEELIFSIHKLLEENQDLDNPQLATLIQRTAREILKNKDLYDSEKKLANKTLQKWYAYWKSHIKESTHPFATAAKMAVVGNIIDYGAHSLQGDLIGQLNKLNEGELRIDKSEELKVAVKKAKRVLYLGDNAGEIFFDRLFIETMEHPNVYYATRGMPVINDVTVDDAQQVGLDKICKIISNGYDAPSTLLDYCSDEFLDVYRKADLIIAKGMGNFEGLMNVGHPNTYFMLIAKCKPIAELLGVEENDMVITQLNSHEKTI